MNPIRRLRVVVGGGRDRDPRDVERELLRRVGRGDDAAFAELFDLIAPTVHGVVLRVLRDPAQSEEVTQEVMVELWRIAPRYDAERGSVRAWATTVAHRRAVDRVRSTQSSRDREQRDATRVRPDSADPVAELVADELDRERLVLAMERLTDAQRESIELAYWSGYTYREVAVVLDVPEGTVKTRIRDGLIRLRDDLGVTG